ncbi:MAG: HTTM domain-containing protein [Pseudomonadota bacterium]
MWTSLKTVFGIDLRSLAAFRVGVAVYILVDLANRWPYLNVFYTDAGILGRAEAIAYNYVSRWSLFYISGEAWVVHVLFVCLALAALSLLVGYRTRLSIFICWVLVVSLTNRNLFLLQGDDDLICILLFWGLFLPLSARFSVDDALREEHDHPVSARPRRRHDYVSPASVAAVLQVSYVYIFGAFLKTGVEWHEQMNAVYYALSIEGLTTPLGDLLLKATALHGPLTGFVWWLELLMPLCVFMPLFFSFFRSLGLALLIAMHIGFALFLNVGLFPLASIASLMLLIPTIVWQWLDRKTDGGEWTLFYDDGCVFCRKTCLLLRSFCLPYETIVTPAQGDQEAGPILEKHNSWVVRAPSGTLLTHWDALVAVLKNNPLTWPFGVLSGLLPRAIGRALYVGIGNSRGGFGAVADAVLPFRSLALQVPHFVSAIVTALAAFVFLWNVDQDPRSGLQLPTSAQYIAKLLRINQNWAMFAPFPVKREGWYGFEGTLKNGLHMDLWTGKPGYPPSGDPDDLRAWNKDYRWRKYLARLHLKANARQRGNLARYWCRQEWLDANGAIQPLASIKMTYYTRTTQPDGRPDTYTTFSLYTGKCN